jgi:hypothetical protein
MRRKQQVNAGAEGFVLGWVAAYRLGGWGSIRALDDLVDVLGDQPESADVAAIAQHMLAVSLEGERVDVS